MAPRRRIPAPDSTKAVAYLRVSTEDQNLGPRAQREAIRRWAAAEGVEVVAWHVDHGVSGGALLDKRPALLEALDDLRARGAGLLVVAKRDRLARDVAMAALVERLVEKERAKVASADGTGNGDTPEAGLIRSIMDAFAQYERAIIRARTSAALQVKRDRGEATGGNTPYGWRVAADGVRLVKVPAEQSAIQRAKDLRSQGLSYRAVCERLADEGHQPRGTRWYPASVKRVCEYEPADAIA